ncbi:MAG: dockerin type I repeat-containing protein [Pirellulales bacterium]|nr:dockerin type I repeat-containing protein [Pirellulales bacterium]
MRTSSIVGLTGLVLLALAGVAGASPSLYGPGDATGDGYVDVLDARALAAHWLRPGEWADGDFNSDGIINDLDASIMAANWHVRYDIEVEPDPEHSTNPEASSLIVWSVLGLCVGAGFWRRNRRPAG